MISSDTRSQIRHCRHVSSLGLASRLQVVLKGLFVLEWVDQRAVTVTHNWFIGSVQTSLVIQKSIILCKRLVLSECTVPLGICNGQIGQMSKTLG